MITIKTDEFQNKKFYSIDAYYNEPIDIIKNKNFNSDEPIEGPVTIIISKKEFVENFFENEIEIEKIKNKLKEDVINDLLKHLLYCKIKYGYNINHGM